jgi:PEP-CTERM motif
MVAATMTACAGMAQAQATNGSFDCITDNSTASCSQGESTLSWDWDGGSLFRIFNTVGGGYVSEVYFDLVTGMDASFNAGASSTGVSFTAGARPARLPGGNAVGFTSDEGFDSNNRRREGINGGEHAAFTVTGTGGSFGFLSGLHVRSLIGGESESFVTVSTPITPPIPEPSTYALMLAGLSVIGFVARRRRPA